MEQLKLTTRMHGQAMVYSCLIMKSDMPELVGKTIENSIPISRVESAHTQHQALHCCKQGLCLAFTCEQSHL